MEISERLAEMLMSGDNEIFCLGSIIVEDSKNTSFVYNNKVFVFPRTYYSRYLPYWLRSHLITIKAKKEEK